MPGERFPTSGGENHENELSRGQKVEQLDEKDVKLLQKAVEELGLDSDLAFTYEDDMDDATLDKFLNKVKELEGGNSGSEPAGAPENETTGTQNAGEGASQGSGERTESQERRERTQKEKKEIGSTVRKAALTGALVGAGALVLLTNIADKIFGGDKAKQEALDKLNNENGIVEQDDDTAGEDSETEHQFGERYEDIAAVATTHGHFANEDGTGYNADKYNDFCFSEGYELTDDEQNRKDQICEELVQTETLGTYYTYFGEHAKAAGVDNYGVEGVSFENANDVVDAMEGSSDTHQKVYDYVYDLIQDENTHVNQEKVSGRMANYYMQADFSKGDLDVSKDLEVVGCYTNESDTDVFDVEMSLESSSGVMVQFDGDLKVICTQPLDEEMPGGYTMIELEDEPDTGMDLDVTTPVNPPDTTTPPSTPPNDEKDPDKIKERAGGDVDPMEAGDETTNPKEDDTDGDGVNDYDDKETPSGGEKNHDGEDGDINNNINNADQEHKNDQNVENQSERDAEEKQEAANQEKENEAKSKADEEEKKDHNEDVSMSDLGF